MTAPRRNYAWLVLVVATLVVFGALGLARFGYTMVLPSMQESLDMDNTTAGGLATANLVGYLAWSAIGGALAARFGPRRVISLGLALAGVGMLLTALSNRFPWLAAWRLLTGIGSGASNVPAMGMLSAWFAARRRGLATGVASSGSSIALILLGPLTPRVLAAYGDMGWRACWVLFAGVTALLALLSYVVLRDRPSDIGAEPVGGTTPGAQPTRSGAGMHWRQVYRSLPIWHLGLVYIAFGFSYIIYMTFFSKRLIAESGYTPEAAGNLFMIVGWVSLFCGLLWGAVSDIIGRKRALIIVYLIQASAYVLFALWAAPLGYTLSAILFGLTAWSIPAIMAAACGDILGSKMAPAALGFITLFFGIGQALGPSVAGAMADAAASFTPAFLLAAGVALLGALGAAFLRPVEQAEGGQA